MADVSSVNIWNPKATTKSLGHFLLSLDSIVTKLICAPFAHNATASTLSFNTSLKQKGL
uniref:Uncharacterized protein n=1 Tax=Babesia bovis TaxID=5865 RepID=S6B790_BABBO|nr:hypothetical protein [Babesia bovis]